MPKKKDPAPGTRNHLFATVLLQLIHNQNKISRESHDSRQLPAAVERDINASLPQQSNGLRFGRVALKRVQAGGSNIYPGPGKRVTE